jgi:ABC-type sugar transport system permease subunit
VTAKPVARKGAPPRGGAPSILSILWRIVGLTILDAMALAFAYSFFGGGLALAGIILLIITLLINVVFLVDRLYPLRWISPGVFLLVLMIVYPVIYTVYIAFTNYSGQHILSKAQVIAQLEDDFYTPEGAPSLKWTAFRSDGGKFIIWLTDPLTGNQFLADQDSGIAPVVPGDPRFGAADPSDKLPVSIDGYKKVSRVGTLQYLTSLSKLVITGEINGQPAQLHILSLDKAIEGLPRYAYDPATDSITDRQTQTVFTSRDGFFVAPDGVSHAGVGFSDTVGLANFQRVLTDQRLSGAFVGVFIWTFVFAGVTVLLCFSLGLALALVFNDQRLPLKGIMRTLAIIPYTIPGFISILIWVGLLNPTFGPINGFLRDAFGLNPQWFNDGTLAKVAIFTINTWLGYPYMLIVTLGALQSIPGDLYEAAEIDGASGYQRFRHITFPLLLVAVTPLLIGAFAFNFNNFTLIELVTQGGPAVPGSITPAGQTDILISYSYRLAFAAGKGNDYAFAATISIFIFAIIAAITLVNFRLSRRVENLI